MPKTYTAAGTVVAGDVYTAAAHNIIATDVNNLIVPPACRAVRATLQTIATGTDTFVTWPTESYDTDGMFTAGSDTITIQTAGLYIVTCSITFVVNATGFRVVNLYKSPSSATNFAVVFANSWHGTAGAGLGTTVHCSGVTTFAAGDTVKVGVAQSSGGNLDVGNASFSDSNHVSVTWIGRTS
jgi:hypothetical protein